MFDLTYRFGLSLSEQLGDELAFEMVTKVLIRYQSDDRAYHNVGHLAAMLDVLTDFGAPNAHPELYVAVLYHDAIYDSRAKDNESASAALARRELSGLGLDPSFVNRVDELIMMTRDHVPPTDDEAAAWLVDADLAILAASPADYDAYARAIRAEYAWVPEPDYRRGRAQVLTRFLARSPLFWVPAHQRDWEEAARANLARELAELSA